MNASNTHKTLEALADIFLTAPGVVSESDKSYARRLLDEANGIHVPSPVRLGPKVRSAPAAPSVNATTRAATSAVASLSPAAQSVKQPQQVTLTDPYHSAIDELLEEAPDVIGSIKPPRTNQPRNTPPHRSDDAAQASESPRLHLADETPQDASPPRPRRVAPDAPPRLEVVILGSLPGFGGPWLTQYAHHLAQRDNAPVAVIHLHPRQTDVELVTSGAQPGQHPSQGPAHALPPAPESGTIEPSQLAALLQGTSAGLIHLGEIEQLQELGPLLGQTRFTILCGAYDAAVVDAFARIKQILAALPGDAGKASLGVMIMGSDQDKSLATLRKLNAAAGDLLTTPIELSGWRKRMEPLQTRPLASLATEGDRCRQLVAVLAEINKTRPATASRPAVAQTGDEMNDDLEMSAADIRSALLDDEDEDAAGASEPRGVSPRSENPRPTSRNAASAEPQRKHDTPPLSMRGQSRDVSLGSTNRGLTPCGSDGGPDLSRFLADDHTIALEARCPKQPLTELRLDDKGLVHLLHHVRDGANPQEVFTDLMATASWVRENFDLLRLTQRQCRFDHEAQPVLHLFTDQARAAAAMVAPLGHLVHLHLLQRVRLGEHTTWCCAELTGR